MISAELGYGKTVTALLDHGAQDIPSNSSNPNQWSSLMLAAKNGHADVVKLMMDRIPDKNPKTFDGRCPIHFAASKGHFQTVQLIMEEIQDKNPKTDRGITPLHLASQNGHLEICKLIIVNVNNKKKFTSTKIRKFLFKCTCNFCPKY